MIMMLTACALAPADISVSYSTIVPHHVSDIMSVFLADDLNQEWSPSLESHTILYSQQQGALAHQQHKLPWPLAPRDMLLKCDRTMSSRDGVITSECHSVEDDIAPMRQDVVRLWLSRTA